MNNLNYGVIGNCRTAALISEKGNIEWLCFPDFDSPSIFAALLDRDKGGCFGFEVSNEYHISQSYVPHIYYPPISLPTKENLSCSTSCRATVPMKKSTICPQKYIVISVG